MNIIWTNDLDFEDWRDDLAAEYPAEEGYTENELIRLMYEINDEYLGDEQDNLNKELDNDIVVFANLGLWHGKATAYRKLGSNLNSIFQGTCGDYVTWYVEGEDIQCKDVHHDGTNHYTYRVLKKDVSFEDFKEYYYDHSINETIKDMTEPLGHYAAEIYGWEIEHEAV